MLREIEFYHGAVLARLVRASRGPIEFELLRWDRSFNAYLVNREIGLYLKYSTLRIAQHVHVTDGISAIPGYTKVR